MHSRQPRRPRPLRDHRALAPRRLLRDALRRIARQELRRQQVHRDPHRIVDRDPRDVLDLIELHNAVDDVVHVPGIDASGETDGDRRVQRLALLQSIDGMRLGGGTRVLQRRRQRRWSRNRDHSRLRNIFIRCCTLSRIVRGFPNLCCRLRCILFLRAPAECGGEQPFGNEDHVTFSGRESLTRVGLADEGVVPAGSGEPLRDVPERFPFDAARADDDVLPAVRRAPVFREERADDVALQLGAQQRIRNVNRLVRLQRLVGFIERRDLLPVRSVPGDPPGEPRPRVALVWIDRDVDLVVAREGCTQGGRDLCGGDGSLCGERTRLDDQEKPHPPATHGRIVHLVLPTSGYREASENDHA